MQKRLDKFCPLCPVKESLVIETVYKDSIIKIPGETVTLVDSVYCDSLGNVYSIRMYEKDGQILRLKSLLKNNKYTVDCVADTIYKEIQLPSKTITLTTTLPPIVERYVPWWVSFLAVLGGILFVLLLLYFGRKLIKAYTRV